MCSVRVFWHGLFCLLLTCSLSGCYSQPAPTAERPEEIREAGFEFGEPKLAERTPQPASVESAATPRDNEGQPASSVLETPSAKGPVVSTQQARRISGDWPMWGGDASRNMVNTTTGVSIDFEPPDGTRSGKKLVWVVKLGSQTYGQPVVAGGKVFVSTNNGGNYLPKHRGDRGCLLCFDEASGKFLWQLTRQKLPQGRVNDWPEQGIASVPCVEGERLWVLTNRAELMCVDTRGFHDTQNDGPYQDEVDKEQNDADIVWSLDLIEELGVFPHNLATSAPVVLGDLIFIVTGNGIDEAHLEVPSPRSPSFLAVNKHTGECVWEDNSPFDEILHGQWSCPSIGLVDGKAQVYMAGGNGWLYAFEPLTGEPIWRFDLNPKDAIWELGGRGTRNSIIATPVFFENSVLLAVGQDPEHGEGVGHLYRIDATKTGDVSPQTADGQPNPNSAQIWHYGGRDEDGVVTGRKGDYIFRRTLSNVAVADGLVFAADTTGYVHCLDFRTGKRYWEYDTLAAIWSSPMVVDGKVFVGDEDGDLAILQAGKEKKVLAEKIFPSSFYSTPVLANGRILLRTARGCSCSKQSDLIDGSDVRVQQLNRSSRIPAPKDAL